MRNCDFSLYANYSSRFSIVKAIIYAGVVMGGLLMMMVVNKVKGKDMIKFVVENPRSISFIIFNTLLTISLINFWVFSITTAYEVLGLVPTDEGMVTSFTKAFLSGSIS
jgi:hypothetical protein